MKLSRRSLPLLLLLLWCAGCWIPPQPLSVQDNEEGNLLLYLEPLAGGAGRIRFTLQAISAVREDGSLVPLRLHRSAFGGGDRERQRLIASGPVEPGGYRGLVAEAARASLMTEEGEAGLLLPEEPVTSEASFRVQPDRPLVLSLALHERDAVVNGIGFSPVFRVAVPVKPLASLTGYVTNSGSGTITVFDKKRMRTAGALPGGRGPRGMVLDAAHQRAYVALSEDDAIAVIDVSAGEQIDLIRLLGGDRPVELALADRGRMLLAVNAGSESLSFVDPDARIELDRIPVGKEPASLALDRRDGRRAYVFNTGSSAISVIDIPTRSVTGTARIEERPVRGEFNRSGDRLYVMSEGSPFLTVLDPITFSIVRRFSLGLPPTALKVDTNTDLLYVAVQRSDEVYVYDPFSQLPAEVIQAGSVVDRMAIDGEANALLLLSSEARTLTSVSINSKAVLSVLDVGRGAYQVSVHGER